MSCSQSQLDPEEINVLVRQTVKFLVAHSNCKFPIRREDIVKNAMKNHGRSFRVIIEPVKNILKEVYGLDLNEIAPKLYIFLPANGSVPNILEWESEERKSRSTLLMIVLSVIFMKSDCVSEEVLVHFLSQLGIMKDNYPFVHPYFGDVRNIIDKEFTRQLYVEKHQIPNTDPARYEYQMGKRAELEVSKLKLLQFVSEIFGAQMQEFTSQYNKAIKAEVKLNNAPESQNMEVD